MRIAPLVLLAGCSTATVAAVALDAAPATPRYALLTAHKDANCEEPAAFAFTNLLDQCVIEGAGRTATAVSWRCTDSSLEQSYWNPQGNCTTHWKTNQQIALGECVPAPSNYYGGYFLRGVCDATPEQIQNAIPKPRTLIEQWDDSDTANGCAEPAATKLYLSDASTKTDVCINTFTFNVKPTGVEVSSYDFPDCTSKLDSKLFPYGTCQLNDLGQDWQPVAPRDDVGGGASSTGTGTTATSTGGDGAGDTSSEPWPESYACEAGKNISSYAYDLRNQTWLVTGSDGRLGGPVTEYALRSGAAVVATSRDQPTADANCASLRSLLGPHTPVTCYGMDLSNLTEVREVVAGIVADRGGGHGATTATTTAAPLDVVLHVAATAGRNNLTADGFVETVQVNALAPVVINDALFGPGAAALGPPPRRVLHVGSANCYDPLDWPAAAAPSSSFSSKVDTALRWINGSVPGPQPANPYYWYSFSKFVLLQYAAELATRYPDVASFSVNPGFFRDDPSKYKDQCKPQLLFEPCPQYPMQGASSTFFTAAQPGIEAFSGGLIDFNTTVYSADPFWVQQGDSCVPRPLPPGFGDDDRNQWYDAVTQLVAIPASKRRQ